MSINLAKPIGFTITMLSLSKYSFIKTSILLSIMKSRKLHILLIICQSVLFLSCGKSPDNVQQLDILPDIYPDYVNITIPPNIAPLNFVIKSKPDAAQIKIIGSCDSLVESGGSEICFSEAKWKNFLSKEAGHKLTIKLAVLVGAKWVAYKPFVWLVSHEEVDSYLSYRLIEPGYEVWSDIRICERNLTTFDERTLANNNQLDKSCMNCHIYGNQSAKLSMFHLRGKDGGTILNRNGRLRKLKLKTDDMKSGAVYGGFHPSGRYGVFSTNVIIPEFHTLGNKRMEVYDTISDLIVCDFDKNRIVTSPVISRPDRLETFPVFSPDGKYIYFCTANKLVLPRDVKKMKYSLCRIGFNSENQSFGTRVDTIWNARKEGKSVSFPRISPDGKFLLCTLSDYGTFPIWHREADLCMINLRTNKAMDLRMVNSNRSDTYHSWSANSRWFVFASKRGDGQYGKPYFAYVDSNGTVHKPFVLPQKNPSHYDEFLYSYNIPELATSSVHYDGGDIEQIYHDLKAELFYK